MQPYGRYEICGLALEAQSVGTAVAASQSRFDGGQGANFGLGSVQVERLAVHPRRQFH